MKCCCGYIEVRENGESSFANPFEILNEYLYCRETKTIYNFKTVAIFKVSLK